jgi:serine/threonine protein kinase
MGPLAKFQQLQKIGEGGMGVVYRGWDPAIGRPVAIKFVRLSGEGNSTEREEFAARLRREGQAAGNLSHPNIVTIYDFVEQADMAYIVMEYVDGRSLEEWLADCELLGPHVVLDIIRQSAIALDYAHGKGVVHRDVKPSNILIRSDGMVKLVDFGLAKVAASSRLTQTGSAIGTPHYMSAEQIDSEIVDARSDQYSLAVCTYEMMTGTRPFAGGSLHSLFNRILNSEPASPRELNSTLGDEIGEVLLRALSKRPAERFPSCAAFATALDRACALTPAWRPKASAPTRSAAPGNGGVAVATPMPTPIDLNKLGANLEPWVTEVLTPRSVSLPPSPPKRPPDAPAAARKHVEPPPPPLPPATPMFRDSLVGSESEDSRTKLYAAIAIAVVLALALVYALLTRSPNKAAAPRTEAPAATPAPVVVPQSPAPKTETPAAPQKQSNTRRPSRPKKKTAAAAKSDPEPPPKAHDPMNLISRPAAPIPLKKQ